VYLFIVEMTNKVCLNRGLFGMVQKKVKWTGTTKSGNGLSCLISEKLLCVNDTQSSYSPAVSHLTLPGDHLVSLKNLKQSTKMKPLQSMAFLRRGICFDSLLSFCRSVLRHPVLLSLFQQPTI